MPTFSAEPLTAAAARILEAAGAPAEASAKLATWLVRADLSGHPSHGVIRIPDYIDRIRQGAFIPDGGAGGRFRVRHHGLAGCPVRLRPPGGGGPDTPSGGESQDLAGGHRRHLPLQPHRAPRRVGRAGGRSGRGLPHGRGRTGHDASGAVRGRGRSAEHESHGLWRAGGRRRSADRRLRHHGHRRGQGARGAGQGHAVAARPDSGRRRAAVNGTPATSTTAGCCSTWRGTRAMASR